MRLRRWLSLILVIWALALLEPPSLPLISTEPARLELAGNVVAWDIDVDPLYRPGPLKRHIADTHFIGTSKQAVYHSSIDNYYDDLRGWDAAGLKLEFYTVAHLRKPGVERPTVIFREAYPEQMPEFCGGPASGCVLVKPQRCVVTTAVTNSTLPAGNRTFGPMVLNELVAGCFGVGGYIDPFTWMLYAQNPPRRLTYPPSSIIERVKQLYSLT
jgi:hypothetical protein